MIGPEKAAVDPRTPVVLERSIGMIGLIVVGIIETGIFHETVAMEAARGPGALTAATTDVTAIGTATFTVAGVE
jgi:hypothetical protein